MSINKDLVAASATPLILSILSEGESYGYAIIKHIRRLSGGEIKWTDGMLYPLLHRLEDQGLIQSRERVAESGRIRRYYRIKKKGAKTLEKQRSQWAVVYSTLRKVWRNKPCLT